eukprot:gene246-2383_t
MFDACLTCADISPRCIDNPLKDKALMTAENESASVAGNLVGTTGSVFSRDAFLPVLRCPTLTAEPVSGTIDPLHGVDPTDTRWFPQDLSGSRKPPCIVLRRSMVSRAQLRLGCGPGSDAACPTHRIAPADWVLLLHYVIVVFSAPTPCAAPTAKHEEAIPGEGPGEKKTQVLWPMGAVIPSSQDSDAGTEASVEDADDDFSAAEMLSEMGVTYDDDDDGVEKSDDG